jgi:hypothetical protein
MSTVATQDSFAALERELTNPTAASGRAVCVVSRAFHHQQQK